MVQELFFGILGGLALFIYGIQIMGEGLQKAAGDKVRYILKTLTTRPIFGIATGAGITSIIQSSSATSVLAIGFVNAGLMQFTQALGIIFGANIGTTITAQIIAFKLTHYALPIVACGFTIYFLCKNRTWKNFGYFLLGLGILFLGLSIMTNVLKPLAASPIVKELFVKYSSNTWIALFVGIVATTIFQSSSATTGIVITLASVGLLDLQGAIPILLGCNIGTCSTAMAASIGTSIHAKRVAISHLMFNIIGVLIFLPFLGPFRSLTVYTATEVARQVANAHTIFNIVSTLIMLPFIKYYAMLISKLVPGKDGEHDYNETKYLDSNLLHTPSIAIEAATKEIIRMLRFTQKMVIGASISFYGNNESLAKINNWEKAVDARRLAITEYLTKIMEQPLNHNESTKIPALMHVASDIERIGDHAENLKKLALQKIEGQFKFSETTVKELKQMQQHIFNMIDQALEALQSKDQAKTESIFQTEDIINNLRNVYKNNHIRRLSQKTCCVSSGIVFIDIIANFEKIGDHLVNIAQAILGGLQWKGETNV